MSSPKLYIHAGSPKTGSSALQSAFALSIDALHENGIRYPVPHNLSAAQAGEITSGNFNPLKVSRYYEQAASSDPDARGILLSNEACFRHLCAPEGSFLDLVQAGVDIDTLLFIRNPVEMAISSYGQTIKRQGSVSDPKPFFAKFGALHRTEQFIEFFDTHGLPLTIRNYANARDDLYAEVERFLAVPTGTLALPPVANVNRSMTRAEAQLLRSLNAAIGQEAASFVADALCNSLPDIKAEPPRIGRAAYDALVDHVSPVVERLNKRLPPEEAYRITPFQEAFGGQKSAPNADMMFSDDQKRVIREALAKVTTDPVLTSPPGSGIRQLSRVARKAATLVSRWR